MNNESTSIGVELDTLADLLAHGIGEYENADSLITKFYALDREANKVQLSPKCDVRVSLTDHIDFLHKQLWYWEKTCRKSFRKYKQLIGAYYEECGEDYYPERGADWFPDCWFLVTEFDSPEPGSFCTSIH